MNYMLKRKRTSGFTLIELLIVISIIGVLSVLFINTSTINLKRGRDAKRKSDLESIRAGIETYRSDCNSYPLSLSFGGTLKGNDSTVNCLSSNTYIGLVPTDPSTGRVYLYSSNGTTYQICASLETGMGSVSCGGSSACGSATCNYQVTSP
jgi:general secretion pathway protein G